MYINRVHTMYYGNIGPIIDHMCGDDGNLTVRSCISTDSTK